MKFEHYVKIHQSGKLKEAEKGYRRLLSKKKFHPDLLVNLGLICAKTGRDKESIYFFNEALKINSTNLRAINNLGLIYIKKKNYKKAKKYFLDADKISKNPKQVFY